MMLPVVRSLLPLVLLTSIVLSGCASFETGAAQRVLSPVEVLDDGWFEHCITQHGDSTADQRPLLVVVLSPRMANSLLEWPRMQREASDSGFRVQAWLDSRTPDAEWLAVLASPPMQDWQVQRPYRPPAGCLTGWSAINHFPYVRVFLGKHLHAWPIWGVMPGEAWQAVLGDRLDTLKTAVSPSL
ncbi:hypothetical protein LPB72_18595 [Hydrogenophaga crassostreae]|uniref:Uncharacterized protein n=2 Tax=Hydrogenophaga crassostreae TaxID=1763535 RepID=A0A167H262_9BURK|nr:hypothetical protein LPB072_09100 [Hydrogenophaga crassostreae]OAD40163.1 hypothetical protein LPB72_18595 [Hydrogenophaga crassostreae]